MKTYKLITILLITIINWLPSLARDNDITVDGFGYKVNLEDMTAEVMDYDDEKFPTKNLVIPGEVEYQGRKFKVVAVNSIAMWSNKENTFETISLPETIEKIGSHAFCRSKNLSSIDIPASVEIIGQEAFAYCNLQSITIPASVKELGYRCFEYNPMYSFYIEDSEEELGSSDIFWRCDTKKGYLGRWCDTGELPSLEELSLGKYIKYIHSLEEEYPNLKILNIYNSIPPDTYEEFTNKEYMDLIVNIPKGSLDNYKSDPVWSKFWNLRETLD